MTTQTYPPKIAAAVLALKENTLRTYHTRGKLTMKNEPIEGQWRAYTLADLVAAAVMAELVRHGIPLTGSNWAAQIVEDERKHFMRETFWLAISQGLDDETFYDIPGWKDREAQWQRAGIEWHGSSELEGVGRHLKGSTIIVVCVHQIRSEIERRLRIVLAERERIAAEDAAIAGIKLKEMNG